MWYLKRGITLPKDNLLKRNWKGDGSCCFCSSAETIQHLFFDCHVAKSVWYALLFTFGIQPPVNFTHLLGSWLAGLTPNLRKPMLVGVVACCWAIWLTRNDAVFSKIMPNSYLQVLFRGMFWARLWSLLSKKEAEDCLRKNCQRLEGVMLEFTANGAWNFRKRLQGSG